MMAIYTVRYRLLIPRVSLLVVQLKFTTSSRFYHNIQTSTCSGTGKSNIISVPDVRENQIRVNNIGQ